MFLQISGQAAIFDTYSIASRIYSNSSEPEEEHYGKFGEWACSGYEEEFENEKVARLPKNVLLGVLKTYCYFSK
jgi:hypothetical protein